MIYKIELFGGYVSFTEADSIEEANSRARADIGRLNVERVTLASEEDLQWVKAMGGEVPKRKPRLPSEWAKEGYYVVGKWEPKVGDDCNYYDRHGFKRDGLVHKLTADEITFQSVRRTSAPEVGLHIVTETFKIRHGRE